MIVLATTFSCRTSPERRSQWDYCLRVNTENPNINVLYAFLDGISNIDPESLFPGLRHSKVSVVQQDGFPSLKQISNYVAAKHPGKPCIIANADIFFDNGSNIERVRTIQPGNLWCISRYDWLDGEWYNRMVKDPHCVTYDSFAFRIPLPDFDSDILIGKLDADPYICKQAREAGIMVLNPSLSIISKHRDSLDGRGLSIWEVGQILLREFSSRSITFSELRSPRFWSFKRKAHANFRPSSYLKSFVGYREKEGFSIREGYVKPSRL